MFNIKTLAVKDSATLHLQNPSTGELLYADEAKKQPVEIELYSRSSKAYRTAVNAMQNRALKRGNKKATAEVLQEEGIELLVACSIKANNFTSDGDAIDNPAAFRELYSDASLEWIKDQVDSFLGDISSFIPA